MTGRKKLTLKSLSNNSTPPHKSCAQKGEPSGNCVTDRAINNNASDDLSFSAGKTAPSLSLFLVPSWRSSTLRLPIKAAGQTDRGERQRESFFFFNPCQRSYLSRGHKTPTGKNKKKRERRIETERETRKEERRRRRATDRPETTFTFSFNSAHGDKSSLASGDNPFFSPVAVSDPFIYLFACHHLYLARKGREEEGESKTRLSFFLLPLFAFLPFFLSFFPGAVKSGQK